MLEEPRGGPSAVVEGRDDPKGERKEGSCGTLAKRLKERHYCFYCKRELV